MKHKLLHEPKAVVKLRTDGVFVEEYQSATLAADMNDVDPSSIFNNLSGRTKTCKGFIFRYKKDYEKLI